MNGAQLIAAERERQIAQEGWTPEHDDGHTKFELTNAAIAYALSGSNRIYTPSMYWPWQRAGTAKEGLAMSQVLEGFKPTMDIPDLVKAGALLAAEIDRLQRAKATAAAPDLRA